MTTKADIVHLIYSNDSSFSRKEATDSVDTVFEIMREVVCSGRSIKVSGFGNFVLRDKNPRPGRNPKTGELVEIEKRRVLTFRASQVLKNELNLPDA